MHVGFDEVDCHDRPKEKPMHRKPPYRNQLMLSEWLLDPPDDFEHNWYTIICPIAKRCLVIAAKGTTTSYSRSGHKMDSFPSHLPGGCKRLSAKHHYSNKTYCILDCLYDSTIATYYILDVMCWMGHPVYDSDTEFRNYWLNTKVNEHDYDLAARTGINPYKFIPLEYHNSSRPYLTELLSRPYPVQVDGLLFIHKHSHYQLGHTPLALWLKPHMLTDLLGLVVSQEFLSCTPLVSSSSGGGGGGGGNKMETESKVEPVPSTIPPHPKKQIKVEAMYQED